MGGGEIARVKGISGGEEQTNGRVSFDGVELMRTCMCLRTGGWSLLSDE
jgi:hypothetical protein